MNIILRRRKLGNGSAKGIQAASTTGIVPHRNDAPFPANVSYVFRWGCTSNVPEGATVVNSASSIHWCSNKKQGRLDMQAAGVSVPRTWGSHAEWTADQADNVKYVVRPTTHAQGRNLLVSSSWDEIGRFMERHGGGYISELINKVAEYRVAVICGRVAWVARKTPGNPEDVAWNVARGGKFDNVKWSEWPRPVVEQALKAAKVSKTDFCGVDVMVDAEGKAYVLEVNSAPSQTSPYRQQCFAKCFDYIVTKGKDHFDMPVKFGWKSTIHPALIKE